MGKQIDTLYLVIESDLDFIATKVDGKRAYKKFVKPFLGEYRKDFNKIDLSFSDNVKGVSIGYALQIFEPLLYEIYNGDVEDMLKNFSISHHDSFLVNKLRGDFLFYTDGIF